MDCAAKPINQPNSILFHFSGFFFLHFFHSTRRWPPCLSLTSSHHHMLAVFALLWYLCLHTHSSTSVAFPLIDSQVLFLVLCQHCPLCFFSQLLTHLITTSSTLLFVRHPHIFWYPTGIMVDDTACQQSLLWQSTWIFIWLRKRLRACLLACCYSMKCQLNFCIARECMATGSMNNWGKSTQCHLNMLKVYVFRFHWLFSTLMIYCEPCGYEK